MLTFSLCLAAYSHHWSPRIAIAFSTLSGVPDFSMSHSSIFIISTKHIPFLHAQFTSSHHVCTTVLSSALAQGHLCAPSSRSTRLLIYLFLLPGRSRFPTQKRNFSVVHWDVPICSHSYIFS